MHALVPALAASIGLALLGAGSVLVALPAAPDRKTPQPPTAEVAKKCRALAVKAHPTQPAGSKGGAEQAQRDYFRDCIAKGGNMPG